MESGFLDRMIETIEFNAPSLLGDNNESSKSDKNEAPVMVPLLVLAFGIIVAAIVILIAERRKLLCFKMSKEMA